MDRTDATRSMLPETSEDAPPSALRVTVIDGPDRGRSALLHHGRMLLGRAENADLRLSDPTVSLCHAEILLSPQGPIVSDLGSRHGVRVGAVALQRGRVLPGCALRLGGTVLLLSSEATETDATPRSEATSFGGLLGGAPSMRALYALLERLAPTELSLLLQGETGTGKELCARAVHGASRRAAGPFVVLDCAAIAPTLAQSVLFGAERGAYTGATERREGVFQAAHGGVLFLDEVGELPLDLQPLLLRALQQREVVPVGSTRPRAVDVRVVCATWRDLRALVNLGTFREDLYYRLAQATVWLPSLAERRPDVPLLIRHVLAGMPQTVPAAREISEEALQALAACAFPGNVRELRSAVERLALLAEGDTITAADLRFERVLAVARGPERAAAPAPVASAPAVQASAAGPIAASAPAVSLPTAPDEGGPLSPLKEARQAAVAAFERAYLQRLLDRTGGNLSRAAALCGVARNNLRELLRRHNLYSVKE